MPLHGYVVPACALIDFCSMTTGDDQGAQVPALQMHGIAKSFGAAIALQNVDVRFLSGTVTALTGENGSGKSTIAKIMGGVLAPDTGTISVRGQELTISNAKIARSHGIALISQELTLATDLTVAENIYMGRLPRALGTMVSWRKVRALATEVLEAYGMSIDPQARVGDLSLETQQQVEIARALATDPDVLILDEATSSLSEKAAARLLDLVEVRRTMGTAVVMITHRMNEIFQAADTAAVLRDGHIVATRPIAHTNETELVRLMVGRELGDYYGSRSDTPKLSNATLEVSGLRAPGNGLESIDLSIGKGEIVGVAGLSGSGKEVLGHALGGAVSAEGTVKVAGKQIPLGRPDRILKGGLGFVPEDRKAMALMLGRSVAENLALAWKNDMFRYGLRRIGFERRRVVDTVIRYDIRAASTQLPISQLSGGNQQKVTIGRLFELNLPVYVMSEPTRGIDVGAKSAIYTLLREQAARGAAVLFISSELGELCGMCDRVITMYGGRVVAEFTGADINEEAINHAMVTGHTADTGALATA